MASKVFLHIGAMKSGTSFLQQTLAANSDELLSRGILFPGDTWADQAHAVRDLLNDRRDGAKPPQTRGAWRRLVREVRQHSGVAVISMEFLAPAPRRKIRRILSAFSPAEVHVVLTARDLARNIPAMWQEEVQNFHTWTWEEYLAGIEHSEGDDETRAGWFFWRQQDLVDIARRWCELVPPERFTLVTVPRPGAPPEVLWHRFCSVVGVDPDGLELATGRNESIGAASAVVLQRLNVRLAEEQWRWPQYSILVKRRLAKRWLVHRKKLEPRIGFDRPWVADRARSTNQALERLGVRVVGDLDELVPEAVAGVDAGDISPEEQLEAAVEALTYTLGMLARSTRGRKVFREIEPGRPAQMIGRARQRVGRVLNGGARLRGRVTHRT